MYCSKHGSNNRLSLGMLVMVLSIGVTKADINKDKQQCATQLVGLSTCLPYVGGEAKAPTTQCCTGLKLVLANSKVCLCLLIKDRNDPSLNLKINETLALGLPDSCHTPTNISHCIDLLHLQPGSPDAKVFEDFTKGTKSKNDTIVGPGNGTYSTAPISSSSSSSSSGEGRRKTIWYLGPIEIVGLFFIIVMLTSPLSTINGW